ncbi:MAG: PHP domain-containing protein [Oscillospiraceae bacterium]
MVDYHIHTTFSDGEKDFKTVIDLAIQKGLTEIALTDHFDPNDESQRNQMATYSDLKEHFDGIRNYAKNKPISVLCGIETCTGFNGELTLQKDVIELCDIIITSPHYIEYEGICEQGDFFNDGYWNAYKQKVLNMASGGGHILGHPEGYLPIKPMGTQGTTYESRQEICRTICDRYFDKDYIDELSKRLVKSHKACELHGATSTPREWVVKQMAENGVTFSVGSDAHAMNILGKCERAYELIEKYSLKLFR